MIKMTSSHNSVIKSLKVVEEEVEVAAPPTQPPLPPAKKGIVTILGSDSERSKASSIRRTLSADMSSKKWLSQNGFSPPPAMKKIASSDELAAAAAEAEEEEEEDLHSSSSEDGEEDEVKRRSLDVWSSILQSHKTVNSSPSPPYIHPLVKKSAASLTGKSLEICTESLGSETGSDCFSSYPSSESGDSADEEKDDHQSPPPPLIFPSFSEEFRAVKYSYRKKSPPRSFPPPLPSLVRGDDKPSVRMHSRRHQGRLILEAVSVPAQNCFRAERQDGRLVLTFLNNPSQEETEDRDAHKVLDEMPDWEDNNPAVDGYEEEEEEEKEMEIMIGKTSKLLINVNSFIALNNNNKNKNRPALVEEVEDDDNQTPLPHSLAAQPRLRPPAAAFNPYDFFWKKKPTTIATLVHIPTITDQQHYNKFVTKCPKTSACEGKDHSLVLITGRNHSNNLILPINNRGCKEPRMSLFFWDSYCIATS